MLIHELEQQGEWLFRRRSYVPLALAPLAIWEVATHRSYLGNSETLDFAFKLFCLVISLAGLGIRFVVHGWAHEGTSGRNTRGQVAESLNTEGLYSVVRHPLYLGNIVMMFGIMLFTGSLVAALVSLLAYVLFYERIIAAEERFLADKFGDGFRIWAESTPALWPQWNLWVQPDYPFSWKSGLRAEFYGFFAVVAAMTFLDTLDVWFVDHILAANTFWVVLFILSLIAFIILRYLRKYTRVLERPRPMPSIPSEP